MSLNRRRFLFLAGVGAIGGLGLGAFARHSLTGTTANSSGRSPIAAPPTSAPQSVAIQKSAIAPKGLFAPMRGDVRIAVISDLNSAYGSTDYQPQVDQAISLIPDWQPDIVLGGGDMVAGQSPSLSSQEITAMWAGFDRHISAPLRQAKLPFGFTIGNHDASSALAVSGKFLFQNERDHASAYWNDPSHDPGLQFVDRAKFPFYYTFQHKDIFYLVWDASSSLIPRDQVAWAEKSLASEVAQAAKMRIAIGHLPLYAVAVGRDEPGEVLADADKLRTMLERYNVHTYISGHHHAYFPGHSGKLELLHASALGAGPRPLLNSNLPPFNTVTIIDVDLGAASTVYTTYDMKNLQVVDHKTLPRLIAGPTGKLLRLDVQESDLTASERALTWQPSS
ncbi:metallophosphoesterase [Kovacikia minuta CCNUW1]|uniref:metallophosphoesterase family protein n=1 Tax=Kovacikia minuta TaxID=2931930 RepID=UPI001CCCA7D5|nr:metallophosphoesterase [Kovacikia minuta]UBF29231.1 metallophosphoesterase [Kovacikia minuta CCNUW1]